ncbi:MAG: hypothetical protein HY811_01680 [Planctomycetes bacterium]|nr:hypothetical protein [Planctomycetota bacterium]
MKNMRYILLCIFLAVFFAVNPVESPAETTAGATDAETGLKIVNFSQVKANDKNTINIALDSDLPSQTVLNVYIFSKVFSTDDFTFKESRVVGPHRAELDSKGECKLDISDFNWELPAGVYFIKVEIPKKQRKNIIPKLPANRFDKVIIQQTITVGGEMNEVVGSNKRQFEDIKKIIAFYEKTIKDLNAFIETFQAKKFDSQKAAFKSWFDKTDAQLSDVMQKVNLSSYESYPGCYHAAASFLRDIGTVIQNELTNMRVSVEGGGKPYPDEQNPHAPNKLTDDRVKLGKVGSFAMFETVFEMVRMLEYYTESVNVFYGKIKTNSERAKLWEKDAGRRQQNIAEFNKYFAEFQKNYPSEEFQPLYKIVADYLELTKSNIETYNTIFKEGDKTGELQNTLKANSDKMAGLFANALEILKSKK